jgi:hypothetical protein
LGSSLQKRFESELAIFAARVKSGQNIMAEKYKVKSLSMKARGATDEAIMEFFKGESGRVEWEAMKKEAMKAAASTIHRAGDFGYYMGFAYGKSI